ncbi:MAG: tRNA pseudouridine(55) synthase TruB [Candidatus Jacksonbacteria bacterium RIFCSPLOWO2_01_FULL_44_13]|nr:MAG: tRNA pseudouridine(55) synthase TruB [Candidatus Jacksonbacteria bacterium RIFCSPLOWO2_01_FULL_44_13]
MNGFLLINKPAGPTSHDIVNQLRRITGIRQIGHAGTLDPFADGLLIMAIGSSTKLLKYFVGLDKKYRAILFLGATSDTQDKTGVVTPSPLQGEGWGEALEKTVELETTLSSFLGRQLQTPPMYSAKKVNGKKLYELARQGKEIERKPHEIEIYSIDLISYKWPHLTIDVHCSSGTYIRTLGHDIGKSLGYGAYLTSLSRTAIGDFTLDDAITLPTLPPPHTNSTVMVFGVFDLLHKGHEYFFQQAKKFSSQLIVVITTDNNVMKQKKKPPIYTQQERLQHIKALKYVDDAYIGDETDYFALIKKYSPNLICLGYDQAYSETQLRKELKERGFKTHVLRLDAYKPELYKSSIIKQIMIITPLVVHSTHL